MTLFKIVTKHAKRKISIVKGKYAKERRAALKAGDDTTYRWIVSDQMRQEEAVYQEIASECMNHYSIEEQDFIISQ